MRRHYDPADVDPNPGSADLDEYVFVDWLKRFANRLGPFTDVFELKCDKRFFIYRHKPGQMWGLGVCHDDGDETVLGYAIRCSEMLMLASAFVPGFRNKLDSELLEQLEGLHRPVPFLATCQEKATNAV